MNSGDRITSSYKTVAAWTERFFATIILGGALVFGIRSAEILISMDWKQTETFHDLVDRVLLLVIGVELARTLVSHDLKAILNVLAFVVARKTLNPELSVTEIFLSVVAFVLLLAANHFWLTNKSHTGDGMNPGK